MTQENFQLWNSQSTKSATQISKDLKVQTWLSNRKGTMTYINKFPTTQILIATMNEETIFTHNKMSVQYNITAKYLYECATKILVQEAFKAADFSLLQGVVLHQ